MKLISRTTGLLLAAALCVSAVATTSTASSVETAEQPVNLPTPLDGDRTDMITRALVTAFFDRHLRGLPTAPILDGTDPQYPEAVRQDPGQSSGR